MYKCKSMYDYGLKEFNVFSIRHDIDGTIM